jgi:hypothetical protein
MNHTTQTTAPQGRPPCRQLRAALLALTLFALQPWAALGQNPVLVGTWPGHPTGAALSVALTGTKYIVAAGEAGVFIAEGSGPLAPYRLATVATPGTAYSVTISPNSTLAYVADGEAGVQVLSITNLAKPVRVGGCDTPGVAHTILVSGSYAYVADGAAGIQILSLANPTNPVVVGNFATAGEAVALASLVDRLYVACRQGGLQILHVITATNLRSLGLYNPGLPINGVHLNGYYTYLAAGDAGLVVLNLTNAAVPAVLATLDTPGYAHGVSGSSGTVIQVADGVAGLQLVDVSNPAAPQLIGNYNSPGTMMSVTATPNYAYAADGESGLQAIRVSTPSAPVRVGGVPTSRQTLGVSLAGNLAVLADGDYGATVLDVSNPAAPFEQGSLSSAGTANAVATSGGLAWLSEGSSGVESLTTTNPASLVRLGSYDTPGFAQGMAAGGDLIAVADERSGVLFLSSTNPATPTRVGEYDTAGWARHAILVGDRAYVADSFNGLVILSMTNPASPALLGTFSGASIYDVAVQGSLAYVAASGSGFAVLDVSDPTNIVLRGSLTVTGAVFQVAISDHYAYLGLGADGVKVVDVSNPEAPVLVGGYNTPGTVSELTVAGDFLYVADAHWGLTILRLLGTNHSPPVFTSQPQDQFGVVGGSATFSATVQGAAPLSYQWYAGTTPLAGQTDTSLTLTGLAADQSGDYTLVVTNPLGVATSQVATLTVLPAGSSLGWFAFEDRSTLGNWKGVYGTQGQLVLGALTNLTATLSGGSYWAFNTNTTDAIALERPGTTSVTNRISACQFSTTNLEVNVTLPTGQTNRLAIYVMEPDGGRVEQVELVDINTDTVLDSRVLTGLTNGAYLVWDVTGPIRVRLTRLSGYNAVVSGVFVGTTLNQPPALRAQPPASQLVNAGSKLALGAGANGTPAIAFQWSKDGLPLVDTVNRRGSAAPVLNLSGITPADAGVYSLGITNTLGQTFGATSVVSVVASLPEKARFVMDDRTTRGNWKGVYGTAGQLIVGLTTNLPAGTELSLNNGSLITFSANTSDGVALERPDTTSVTSRYSAVQYSATQLVASVNLPVDATNRVAFYLMEPSGDRVERFELLDSAGLVVLDSRTLSGLTNGIYLTYDVNGPVQARLTRVSGANAVLSAVFFGTASNAAPTFRAQPPAEVIAAVGSSAALGVGVDGSPALRFQWRRDAVPLSNTATRSGSTTPVLNLRQIQTNDAGIYTARVTNNLGQITSTACRLTVVTPDPAKATFVMQDATTMGNWKQVYGPQGALLYGLYTNLPAGVNFSLSGASYIQFSANTSEPMALERPDAASPTNRFAAVMFANSTFTLDAELPPGATNRLGLYFMEPSGGRAQRVDLVDPATGILLDSRFLPSLTSGVYLTWDVNGPVRVVVTRVAGANAVLSGVFLGTATTATVVRAQPPAAIATSGGATVVLGAAFSGRPALSYEWRKGGVPLTESPTRIGVTAPVLRLVNLQAADSGDYTVRAIGPQGQATTTPTLLAVVVPDPAKGRFVMQDGTTLGNWKGVYGTEGHLIVGLATNLPAPEKQVQLENGSYYAFTTNTTEANALERPDTDSVTNRFAACQFAGSSLLASVDLPLGTTNRISVYLMEPVSSRTERVELLDGSGLAVLDTRTVTGLSNSVYLVYDVNGPVKIRITRLSGGNAVLSAVFIGTALDQSPVVRTQPSPSVTAAVGGRLLLAAGASGSPALSYRWLKDGTPLADGLTRSGSAKPVLTIQPLQGADAGEYALVISNASGVATSLTAVVQFPPPVWFSFVQQDGTTLGNWKGVYGTLGHLIVGLSTNLPANAQVTLNNGAPFVFSPNTPDANALERTGTPAVTNRFAACQYDMNALELSVDLPTGVTNRLAFYLMEPGMTRAERFELRDPTGGIVLDSRLVGGLSNAVYLVYDVSGPVKARITRVAGANAVLNAVFLGTATDVAPTMRTEPPAAVSVSANGRLILGAGMDGAPALTYQWWKDGIALTDGPNRSGSFKPVLNFGSLSSADAGDYSLVTSNAIGVVTSQTAVVSIVLPRESAPGVAAAPSLFFAPPRVTGGEVRLTLVGEPGATYIIESSVDLIRWEFLRQVETADGLMEFTEPAESVSGRKFYRAFKR